jgi:hypothetical protein
MARGSNRPHSKIARRTDGFLRRLHVGAEDCSLGASANFGVFRRRTERWYRLGQPRLDVFRQSLLVLQLRVLEVQRHQGLVIPSLEDRHEDGWRVRCDPPTMVYRPTILAPGRIRTAVRVGRRHWRSIASSDGWIRGGVRPCLRLPTGHRPSGLIMGGRFTGCLLTSTRRWSSPEYSPSTIDFNSSMESWWPS